MDPRARQEIETAIQAINDALSGLVSFATTLRPTLRNEIFQICGHHFERAQLAKERLTSLLESSAPPGVE